jgi:hypothetical protein
MRFTLSTIVGLSFDDQLAVYQQYVGRYLLCHGIEENDVDPQFLGVVFQPEEKPPSPAQDQ